MKKMCYYCMEEGVQGSVCTLCGAKVNSKSQNDRGMALPLGSELDNGNIIVGEKMGSGGFGITYIARDKQYGLIALKEFLPKHMIVGARKDLSLQILADKREIFQKSLASFRRESRLLNVLQHPNVVQVYFDLEENNTAYYGMRLLKGRDLNKYVQENGKLSPARALILLLPIMDALSYIHRKNTLHRDLSPDNIFLEDDANSPSGFKPYLIDFGAAYTAMDDFTHSMLGVKKNGYSPLEQNWSKDKQGPFTDVYSFAATFYKVITNEVPPAVDLSEVGYADNKKLMPASTYNKDVGPNLDRVLMRGMALLPRERIQSIDQFRREVEKAIADDDREKNKGPQPGPAPGPVPPAPGPVPPTPGPVPPMPGPVPPVPGPGPNPGPILDTPPVLPVPPANTQYRSQWGRLTALIIDCVVFLLLPIASLCSFSLTIGVVLGICLMLVMNTLLLSLEGNGTLGERLVGLEMQPDPGSGSVGFNAAVYNFLRLLLPLSLITEMIAASTGEPRSLIDKVTGFSLAGVQENGETPGAADQHRNAESEIVPNVPPVPPTPPVPPVPPKRTPPGPPPMPPRQSMPPNARMATLLGMKGKLQGQRIQLGTQGSVTLGRTSGMADVIVPDRTVSGIHCVIFFQNGAWFVRDNHSTNFTFVNGKQLPRDGVSAPLRSGSTLRVGDEEFIFELK